MDMKAFIILFNKQQVLLGVPPHLEALTGGPVLAHQSLSAAVRVRDVHTSPSRLQMNRACAKPLLAEPN